MSRNLPISHSNVATACLQPLPRIKVSVPHALASRTRDRAIIGASASQILRLVTLALCAFPGIAHSTDCSGLPTQFRGNEFPTGNFISNFDNPCYTIPFTTGSGGGGIPADLNSIYNRMYYKVDSRYQLIILGTFPNARYFSITVEDDHGASAQSLLDANIVPLTSQLVNPYQPGVPFVAGQRYGLAIDFGGAPGKQQKGCLIYAFNIAQNSLDATQRHQGMNWNADPGVFHVVPNLPLHVVDTPQHSNPNTAGVLNIRNYLDVTPASSTKGPQIIVRDVASGCAYPAAYVLSQLEVVTGRSAIGVTWLDGNQAKAHEHYESVYLPQLCFRSDPQNSVRWARSQQYVAGGDLDTSYLRAFVPSGLPASLASMGAVIRMRFRLPVTPPTPCTGGCSRSGAEQMRYMSISFQGKQGLTLASLADSYFIQDQSGYVTLIVTTGTKIPSWVTEANGYTLFDLAKISGGGRLASLYIREIMPSATFNCAGQFIPYNTRDATPAGGIVGEYLPVVDYPVATSLPPQAAPLVGPDQCAVFPVGQADLAPQCGTSPFPPINISSVTTQCAAPGCRGIVLQSHPPLVLVGAGFGSFPGGLPFSGNPAYLEIANVTQGWDTSSAGSPCTMIIDNWSSGLISLAANINQNGNCPLAAGDQLTITVRNPQTMTPATISATVLPN